MLGPMKTPLLSGFAILAAGCLAASAQEARTWTDIKGRTIEGSFLKQDESTVWVKRGDGREVAIPKKALSEGDKGKIILPDLLHVPRAIFVPAIAAVLIVILLWLERLGGR